MNSLEILGYVASITVFSAFWMKTMIPLRTVGICSNVLFILYGASAGLVPIMLLHGCLLPLNSLRLYQAVRLKRRIHQMAHAEFKVESLIPYMSEHKRAKGTFLFKIGDEAQDIFYLASGRAHIEELDIDLGPGALLGEIAMFSPNRLRTQTVHCTEDCLFLSIGYEQVLQMYSVNPEFGLYLVKMIVDRLLTNSK